MRKKGTNELPKSEDKSSLEKYIVYKLFESKNKRVEARIRSKKEDEETEYKKALRNLLSALNALQNPKGDNNDKRWIILLYNDLSICYAGLENSSMSRGYAEEAKRIIEEEESYKEFDQKFSTDNSANMANITNDKFVSSKLYYLYTVALFNQAVAEKRSSLYTEAERNFRKIIEYTEKDTHLLNLNYYSTLLNLGDLYLDQGRGKEALELLHKVIDNLNKDDIRYWNASLYEITALIEQSRYDDAKELLLERFIEEKNGVTLSKRHKVTSPGIKALDHFARCKIEKVRNTLKICKKDKKNELKKIKKSLEHNTRTMHDRKQEGLETKAYKYLSEIYEILDENKNAIKYLTKYFSNGEIDDLNMFVRDERMDNWINGCDELNALERFSEIICKSLGQKATSSQGTSAHKILKKLSIVDPKIRTIC